jgi:hypothetical protein
MWKPWTWTQASNERAVANAREASIDCSRRRVERAEVDLYLSQHSAAPVVAPRVVQHPA